jgi:hypothetical protein
MNNSTELPDYRCPSDCDCDTCAINKAKQQVHLFKEIEKQFDYCETFHFYRNMHYLNKNEYEKIFSTKLTPHNAIEYGPIFFFMLKIEKSEDGTVEVIPLAPTELKGTIISKDQVDLTWKDNSTNETGFKIEQKTDSGRSGKGFIHS